MLRHHQGDLGYCRFFTTVQGAGRFWNKVMDFIRVTKGIDASLDDPVFQTCIRDEVHSMSGPSDAVWTLGLNIPAVWSASYTATPTVETRSRAAMLRLLKEERRRQREEEGDDDEENDEGDDQRQREGQENEVEEDDHDDETSGAEFTVRSSSAIASSDVSHGAEFGLSGIQVLSRSLQFESLERVLGDASGNEKRKDLAEVIRKAWNEEDGSIVYKRIRESLGIERDIVLFDVRPELDRGDCCCCPARGQGHREWCPASGSHGDVERSEQSNKKRGIFRTYVDTNGKMEWIETSHLTKGPRVGADAIVLGRCKVEGGTFTPCMRRGDEDDVRGLVVHDSSDNQHVENLIGPALATYTFGEAFAEKNPKRILAQPKVATYIIDPVSIPVGPQDSGIPGEDVEMVDTNAVTGDHLSVEDINVCLGYSIETQHDPETNRMVPVGVNVKNASKVFIEVIFSDLQESGKDVPKVVVTLKEYAGMILVIRLLEREGQDQVRKPIVFCPSAASCRRCLALLRLLLRRHSRADGGDDRLEHVGSGHVFESATEYALEDGEPKKSKATMSLHVRKHLLGEFQSSESYVLFNTNLLSTGVDLPCCDGVVLLSPSEKNRTVLQRWGRSLRVESHNVDTKTGTLALVVEDPMEPTELVEKRQRRLGFPDLEVLRDGNGLDADKFRHVLRTAEAAASESNKILGDVFDMATQWRKEAKGVSSGLGVRVFSSDAPTSGYTVVLDEAMEAAFANLFEARSRRLMIDWGRKYAAHEQAMLRNDAKRRLWEEYASRREAVAEMPSGLFGRTSPIPEEKKVGIGRSKLLTKKEWTDDHQAFHDYYYERLKYDFKGHWEANQESRGDRTLEHGRRSTPRTSRRCSVMMRRRSCGRSTRRDLRPWRRCPVGCSVRPVPFPRRGLWARDGRLLVEQEDGPPITRRSTTFTTRGSSTTSGGNGRPIKRVEATGTLEHGRRSTPRTSRRCSVMMRKRRLWEEYASRREAVAEMPSGLFGRTSPIPEEKKVGIGRSKLLTKKEWTDDHQAFHDYYVDERLRYDFKKEWEANKDGTKYQKMYAAHEEAMLNDPEKKKLWEKYASRDEAVAEMPSGLFGTTSPIPEERSVGDGIPC
jgi:hypothetical protein